MATENVLIQDGTQVAAANYGNGAGLSGPGGSGQFLVVAQSTVADRTVVLASAIGQQAFGILQNKPLAGQAADVAFAGQPKAVAGGTIARGAALMTDASGRLITWTAGSGYAQLAVAMESAVVGQIFSVTWAVPGDKVLT